MFQHWNHQLPLLVTFLATQLLHSRPFHSIITVKKTRPFGFKSKGRRSLPPADSRLFKIMSRTMTMHLIVHLKEYAYTPLTYHMMAISTFIGERIKSNNNAVNPFFVDPHRWNLCKGRWSIWLILAKHLAVIVGKSNGTSVLEVTMFFKDVQSPSTPPLEHHQVEASLPVAFVLERIYGGVPS